MPAEEMRFLRVGPSGVRNPSSKQPLIISAKVLGLACLVLPCAARPLIIRTLRTIESGVRFGERAEQLRRDYQPKQIVPCT
jgi:hypothetical protein